MLEAMKLANKAFKKNEVPIGAIIVYKKRIIGKGYNQVEHRKSSLVHAELIAIKRAQRRQRNWRLNDCTLYVTLQPCIMCMGAIIQSRIKTVFYSTESTYLSDVEKEYINRLCLQHKIKIEKDESNNESEKLLALFFKQKR